MCGRDFSDRARTTLPHRTEFSWGQRILEIEPPPPVATNAGCAAPLPLASGADYSEPRIADGATRSYTFTLSAAGSVLVTLQTESGSGVAHVDLKTACGGGTVIASADSQEPIYHGNIATNLAAGTYYLVVTATNGMKYSIDATY